MAKKPSMSATEAKKKAMANRGTYQVATNSDYGKPYHRLTQAAVMPFVKASADSTTIWGDTLLSCVPPAFAIRYRELQNSLDVAMVEEKHQEAAGIAASLVKALIVMDTTARAAGHLPPVIDGHLVRWGDTAYCLLATGDIGAVRRANPLTDCVFEVERPTTVAEVNDMFQAAAQGPLAGILGYETRPLVSADYVNDTRSSIIDALSTMVVNGTQVKIYAWYDNEMGYAHRLVDVALMVGAAR